MKIRQVKFYQGILFEGKTINFINANPKKDSIHYVESEAQISIESGIGVKLESEKDCVIVPFNNVVSISFDRFAQEIKKSKSKSE